jgi:hypothetical protein
VTFDLGLGHILRNICSNQKLKHMKTRFILIAALTTLPFINGFTQSSKNSIAIANPSVVGMTTKPESAAKMLRLEFIKLNQYVVLDEFDMSDVVKANPEFQQNCLGQNCLMKLGNALKVDFVASGSFDLLGNKIAVTIKVIDVKNESIFKSAVKEFDDQPQELQRMIEVTLKEMYGIPVPKELNDRLIFKNELITSNNVGKINNSGPRIGYAGLMGSMHEFATRPESQGGLDVFPGLSMIGYQIEGQYVGTENFSALVEGIFNLNGLEQGLFLPSITIMNGFRFGKAGWEFAFGPGFTLRKTSQGFFDTDGTFGAKDRYFSKSDWGSYATTQYGDDPQYSPDGYFIAPEPNLFNPSYGYSKNADARGDVSINTLFVFAFGRTFRAGALNIPVNVFYSSQRGGGMAGVNVGFNVQKSKTPINTRR